MSLKIKSFMLSLIPCILFLLVTILFITPTASKNQYNEKDIQIKNLVDNAVSIVNYYYEKEQSGLLSREEAQNGAKETIRQLRYGNNDYFWIDNTAFESIMHPIRPQIEGSNRKNEQDANGHYLTQDYIQGAIANPTVGYYSEYYFPKPNEDTASLKRGYVQLFAEWNWVIGTGIYVDEVETLVRTQLMGIIAVIGVIILLSLVITFFFAKHVIVSPIRSVSKKLDEIAKSGGDLTQRLNSNSNDEIGKLCRSFDGLMEKLQSLVSQVGVSAASVASASEQLTTSAEQSTQASEMIAQQSQDSVEGAENQLQSVSEVSSSLKEMANGISQIEDESDEMHKLTGIATELTNNGVQSVQNIVSQMKEISDNVESTYLTLKKLDTQSNEIGNIISIITNIADQTNLLSLNAAIESARAGEHGRGFAVVADEVRKLSDESKKSAAKITGMIQSIQRETNHVVQLMESGSSKVKTGIEYSNNTSEAFDNINSSIYQVSQKVDTISGTVEKISKISDEIVRSIENVHIIAKNSVNTNQEISAATQQQIASMEEITSSAQNLSALAEELSNLIGQFKVSDEIIK